MPWEQIAEKLAGKQKVLAVLNTRKQAKELYDLVADLGGHGDAFHLSTTMCPAHRLEIIKTVGERLKSDIRCRLLLPSVSKPGLILTFQCLAGIGSPELVRPPAAATEGLGNMAG